MNVSVLSLQYMCLHYIDNKVQCTDKYQPVYSEKYVSIICRPSLPVVPQCCDQR